VKRLQDQTVRPPELRGLDASKEKIQIVSNESMQPCSTTWPRGDHRQRVHVLLSLIVGGIGVMNIMLVG